MTTADEIDEFQLSELEKKAKERRERLKNLRAGKLLENGDTGNENSEGFLGIVGRRSYQAVNAGTANVDRDVKEIMEKTDDSVKKIIDDSKNLTLGDNLDVSIIAPRKVDWDLRRGIEDKLDKLERRTNNAISSLVRQKMMKDSSDNLANKVNAITDQFADDS